jgi:hypothetical protein
MARCPDNGSKPGLWQREQAPSPGNRKRPGAGTNPLPATVQALNQILPVPAPAVTVAFTVLFACGVYE